MKYQDLSDEQLIELAKLRMKKSDKNINPTSINIEDKQQAVKNNFFAVSFIVKSKLWADYRLVIVFDKFYPKEFLLLQKFGILF